jgi:hypothetical protein
MIGSNFGFKIGFFSIWDKASNAKNRTGKDRTHRPMQLLLM